MMTVKTVRKQEIEILARKELESFSLYRKDHLIAVEENEQGHLTIGYRTTSGKESIGEARFDVEIKGKTGDILYIHITQPERRKGNGRALYGVVEGICLKLGCTKMQTTPSGQGKYFWPKMGFNVLQPFWLEKDIA